MNSFILLSMKLLNTWIDLIKEFIHLCQNIYEHEFYDMSMNSINFVEYMN